MNRTDAATGVVAAQENTTTAGEPSTSAGTSVAARHPMTPVRLTLASRLGSEIDGAWWPRTGQMSRELPDLISILTVRLGNIIDINVNWSSAHCQQDLNWGWWQGIRPRVMTVDGRGARAKILIVPYQTGTALAVMLLRRAAGLSVLAAHRDSRAFVTADCVLRAAKGEKMFELRRSRRAAAPTGTNVREG